jgi:predicted nucleic acid-binding Zn ribbon protein
MIPIQRYVCTKCGHVEEWVNSKADLLKLTKEHTEQKDQPNRSQLNGSQEASQM